VEEKRFLSMTWEIILSSLILSLILLIPVGIRWEIPKKVSLPASVLIGALTALIVRVVVGDRGIPFYQIVILELFLIGVISASLLLWRFFRDPERVSPEDRNAILSPADGKVIYVKKIEEGTIPFLEKKGKKLLLTDFVQSDSLPSEGYLIGISMNFLNVHVNRAPIDGRISVVQHIRGSFLSLKRKEAVAQNERALTVIDNGYFKVGVIQIASRLVRKIVLYLQEGHAVRKGQRIGMIRFGSQVDLILPNLPFLHIEINPGDNVKAGVSIVAKIVDSNASLTH
jgi:phosphatidylserine decarboxylase